LWDLHIAICNILPFHVAPPPTGHRHPALSSRKLQRPSRWAPSLGLATLPQSTSVHTPPVQVRSFVHDHIHLPRVSLQCSTSFVLLYWGVALGVANTVHITVVDSSIGNSAFSPTARHLSLDGEGLIQLLTITFHGGFEPISSSAYRSTVVERLLWLIPLTLRLSTALPKTWLSHSQRSTFHATARGSNVLSLVLFLTVTYLLCL
jgi:hypothetical protein